MFRAIEPALSSFDTQGDASSCIRRKAPSHTPVEIRRSSPSRRHHQTHPHATALILSAISLGFAAASPSVDHRPFSVPEQRAQGQSPFKGGRASKNEISERHPYFPVAHRFRLADYLPSNNIDGLPGFDPSRDPEGGFERFPFEDNPPGIFNPDAPDEPDEPVQPFSDFINPTTIDNNAPAAFPVGPESIAESSTTTVSGSVTTSTSLSQSTTTSVGTSPSTSGEASNALDSNQGASGQPGGLTPPVIGAIVGSSLLLIALIAIAIVLLRRRTPQSTGKNSLPRHRGAPSSDTPFLEEPLAVTGESNGLRAYATKSILLSEAAGTKMLRPDSVAMTTIDTDELEYVPILLRRATGRVRQSTAGPRYLDPSKNTLIPVLSLLEPSPKVESAFEQCVVAQLGDPTSIPLGESRPGSMGLELTCLPLRTYSAYERPDAIGLGSSTSTRLSKMSDAASSTGLIGEGDGGDRDVEKGEVKPLKPGQISLEGFDLIREVRFRVAYPHRPMLPDEVELRYGDKVSVSLHFKDGWAHGTNETLGLFGAFPMFAVEERSPDPLPEPLATS
ncbi:hypothetical protein HDU67_009943 [Dinochytrium kinnereticum]|nr:hypothetical protein HDU67_009943 [Dinochytrium kinnereticum]